MKFDIGDITERFRNIVIDKHPPFFECKFRSDKWFEWWGWKNEECILWPIHAIHSRMCCFRDN